MTITRLLVLATLALSTPAIADDADLGAPDPAGTRWPRSVILRPLTLPGGVLAAGVDVKTNVLNDAHGFFDPASLRVLVGYGITDDLELGFADYTFPTSGAGDGRFAANLGFKLVRGAANGKLEIIARAQGGYGLAETVNAMMESEGALLPLNLGVHVQYNISEKLCLITPGQQISIGLEDGHASSLDLLVGVGFQATNELYLQLDTSLAHIKLHEETTTFIFSDTTPMTITGVYNATPALDVLAAVGTDLSNDVDQTLTFLVGARYYAGTL